MDSWINSVAIKGLFKNYTVAELEITSGCLQVITTQCIINRTLHWIGNIKLILHGLLIIEGLCNLERIRTQRN